MFVRSKQLAIITLLFFIGLAGMSTLSHAAPLVLAVTPDIQTPTKRFQKIEPGPDAKRFAKTRYEEIKQESQYASWQYVSSKLTEISGEDIELASVKSLRDFEARLAKSEFDLAYINPVQLSAIALNSGYKAIAKRKAQPIKALVVTTADSEITDIEELIDKVLALPNPLSFPGTIVPLLSLQEIGIVPDTVFSGDFETPIKKLITGEVELAATTPETFAGLHPRIKPRVRVLWESPAYTPNAMVAKRKLTFDKQNKIQRALIALTKDPMTAPLMRKLFIENGFETATDKDWRSIDPTSIKALN